MIYKHLWDHDFLTQLTLQRNKTQHVRLKVFDKKKQPIEYLEGQITDGSINIDGAAAIRRTCSLNLTAAADAKITDSYWSLTHEFEVEIGLENTINSNYNSIVWFPMGHYLISSFSKSENTSTLTISISGQDPMAKLNGLQGGSFPHEVDFGIVEIQQSDGSTLQQKEKIKTIIEQALLQYGQEDLSNIFLNDLPENGLELLEYKGKTPMYLIIQTDGSNITQFINYTLDQNIKVWINDNGNIKEVSVSEIPQYWSLGVLNTSYNEQATIIGMQESDISSLSLETKVRLNVVKLEFGNTIGYRPTDLVYAGDLILKAGENVVSLLDKIKTMLGSFEYFYDTDGRFVLQKKKDYLQELFSPVNGEIIEPLAIVSPYAYEFKDDVLFTSKSIQPKIDNIKNDFVIWTKKSTANGGQVDIHARYAIDKKPLKYISPWGHYEPLSNSVLAYKCKKIDNNYFLDCRDGQVYLSNKLSAIYTQNNSGLVEQKYTTLDQNAIFYQLTTEKVPFSLNDDIVLLYSEIKPQEYRLAYLGEMVTLYYLNNDDNIRKIALNRMD